MRGSKKSGVEAFASSPALSLGLRPWPLNGTQQSPHLGRIFLELLHGNQSQFFRQIAPSGLNKLERCSPVGGGMGLTSSDESKIETVDSLSVPVTHENLTHGG
jgi:hypothetical protein